MKVENISRALLNHGSIELLEYMGSDSGILEAARVSTEALDDPDRNRELMSYLIRNEHHTPLETVIFKFKVKAPIFVARQWFKHRISSFNEKSARYCEFSDFECFVPDEFRKQGVGNRQSGENLFTPEFNDRLKLNLSQSITDAKYEYEVMLDSNVAREHARTVMPVGIYTEWIWTVNLRSLMNFLYLRQHEHAQKEIRVYADAIRDMLFENGNIPMALNSIADYHLLKDAFQRLSNVYKKSPKELLAKLREL